MANTYFRFARQSGRRFDDQLAAQAAAESVAAYRELASSGSPFYLLALTNVLALQGESEARCGNHAVACEAVIEATQLLAHIDVQSGKTALDIRISALHSACYVLSAGNRPDELLDVADELLEIYGQLWRTDPDANLEGAVEALNLRAHALNERQEYAAAADTAERAMEILTRQLPKEETSDWEALYATALQARAIACQPHGPTR